MEKMNDLRIELQSLNTLQATHGEQTHPPWFVQGNINRNKEMWSEHYSQKTTIKNEKNMSKI